MALRSRRREREREGRERENYRGFIGSALELMLLVR